MMKYDGHERRAVVCEQAPCFWRDKTDEEAQQEIKKLAKEGALAVLQELGLSDDGAADDVHSLRAMLSDWRSLKKETARMVLRWIGYIILGVLAVKLGLMEYLKLGKQ